jgi:hypothetical protein
MKFRPLLAGMILFANTLCNAAAVNCFTINMGQVRDAKGQPRPDILYTADVKGARLYFFSDRIAYVASDGNRIAPGETPLSGQVKIYRYDIVFDVSLEAMDQLPGTSNFYFAHCAQGILGAPSYGSLVYHNISKGANLRVEIDNRDVRLIYEGSLKEHVHFEGEQNGVSPFLFEEKNIGNIERIASSTMWTTYIGGTDSDEAWGIDADQSGTCVTGYSQSLDLPAAPGTIQSANAGGYDAFIFKFDNTGNRIWSTYYGGSGNDFGYKVKWMNENAIVCGYGSSSDGSRRLAGLERRII